MLQASSNALLASADVGIEGRPCAPRELSAAEAMAEPGELDAEHLDLWIRALGAFVPLEFG